MPWSNNFLNSLSRYGNGGIARGITDFPDYLNSGIPSGFSQNSGFNFGLGGGGKIPGVEGNWMDNWFGKDGYGTFGLNLLSGLGNAFMGMRQYGLAKQALKQNREQFERNYAAQRRTINTALEDRQRARIASNPGAYEPVDSYMDRNRVR